MVELLEVGLISTQVPQAQEGPKKYPPDSPQGGVEMASSRGIRQRFALKLCQLHMYSILP